MNQKTVHQILQLTEKCLERFWQQDYEYMLRFCKDDVVWIGSFQEEFSRGFEELKINFQRTAAEVQPCHLLCQEFVVSQNKGNCCTIVGRYLTTIYEENECILHTQQRCTFSWEIVRGEPKICHIHVSNPMGELKRRGQERFTYETRKTPKHYLEYNIDYMKKTQKIAVEDLHHITHFLPLEEIVYATSDDKQTILYMFGRSMTVRLGITQFLQMTDNAFIAVHRCYVVNVNYIMKIKKYSVVMTDGSGIPIPVKRYDDIRQKIMKIYYDVK